MYFFTSQDEENFAPSGVENKCNAYPVSQTPMGLGLI